MKQNKEYYAFISYKREGIMGDHGDRNFYTQI